MKTTKTATHGGAREGAGRNSQYLEATTTIAFRIPVSKKEDVRMMMRKYLAKLKKA